MGKQKKKKVNPRRRPATMADVNKAKNVARREAVEFAWAILFMVLRDKMGFSPEDLDQLWKYVDDYSMQIERGAVTVPDLKTVLKEEAGVVLK